MPDEARWHTIETGDEPYIVEKRLRNAFRIMDIRYISSVWVNGISPVCGQPTVNNKTTTESNL